MLFYYTLARAHYYFLNESFCHVIIFWKYFHDRYKKKESSIWYERKYAEFHNFCIRVTKIESALGKISDNFLR